MPYQSTDTITEATHHRPAAPSLTPVQPDNLLDSSPQPARVLALPPEGAAHALNLPRSAVYRLIAQAKQGDPDGLPSIKVGKRRLIPVSALEAFLQRRLDAAS